MAPEPKTALAVATILNAGYLVRMYCRPIQRRQRAAAICTLGLACRDAFNAAEDFEPVLIAILDALQPRDERRF